MRTTLATTDPCRETNRSAAADPGVWPAHAQPLATSRNKGWNGVVAELYRTREVDVMAPFPDHTVTMHFISGVNLLQRRNGRACETRMRAGDIVITPAGEPKALRHQEEAEVLKIKLAPPLLERIAAEAGCAKARESLLKDHFGTRDPQLQHLCREFRAELERERIGARLYVESLGLQLALYLLRHYSTVSPVIDAGTGRLPPHKLRRAIDYMNAHLRDELTLQGIANALSISPFHFAHLFKHTTGLSPHRYVIELRLERAKALLRNTEMPIAEVAQQVGYWNTSHFAVAFHRATGFTPRAFRRNA